MTTERLVLSPLRPDDADAMASVLGDARLHTFTGGQPLGLEVLRRRFERLAAGRSPDGHEVWLNWIIRLGAGAAPGGDLAAPGNGADLAPELPGPASGADLAPPAIAAAIGVDLGADLAAAAIGPAVGTVQAGVTGTELRHATIAWIVGVPWQRRGIAGEAACALVSWLERQGIPSVSASIHPDHVASQRVATRAGLARTCEVVDGEEIWRRLATP